MLGGFTIQLIRNFINENNMNIKIITSCSNNNFEKCKKLGADYCIDYKNEKIEESLNKILKDINWGLGFI
jgi:NADPH:quinone reductase-like Zn-dependent oxidoreductase